MKKKGSFYGLMDEHAEVVKKESELLTRVGIADAHGIESYFDESKSPTSTVTLALRAEFNRQRHAVFFQVKVTKEVDKKMNAYLSKKDFEEALRYLKAHASEIAFPARMAKFYEKSWALIPNKGLDPWS